jgi:hypothetical protein
MEWKDRLNDEMSQSGKKYESFRRNVKVCVLRIAGIVLTLKFSCATFGVKNIEERAYKRREISIRNEISQYWSKFECLRFAISREYFYTEIGLRYFRRVEWSGNTFYTPRYLNQERNNRVYFGR